MMPVRRVALWRMMFVIATPVERLAREAAAMVCRAFSVRGDRGLMSVQLSSELYIAESK
jgi:hypothetical protein